MTAIKIGPTTDRWSPEGYHLSQVFRLTASNPPPDAMAVVRDADACVMRRTRAAAALALARWEGDQLMAAGICLLHLGALETESVQGFAAAAGRAIQGGLIARRPSGSIWYRADCADGELILEAGLTAFAPRLPRWAFRMIQAPVHRATIRAAVRDVAAHLDRAAG